MSCNTLYTWVAVACMHVTAFGIPFFRWARTLHNSFLAHYTYNANIVESGTFFLTMQMKGLLPDCWLQCVIEPHSDVRGWGWGSNVLECLMHEDVRSPRTCLGPNQLVRGWFTIDPALQKLNLQSAQRRKFADFRPWKHTSRIFESPDGRWLLVLLVYRTSSPWALDRTY